MKPPAKPTPPSAPEGDRIAKVLSRAGVASRREAERMIAAGEVAVNGKVITSPALNIGPKDRVTVNGKPLAAPEPPRLWLYYKPEGLVTSAADEKGRDTVFDHLPEDMPRVMSVGRLDLNSEGLLLLTNDGELKRRLELPSTGWLRKYRVRVKGNPVDPDLDPLRKGITVEGETFQPMQVVLDRVQGANAWLTVGLREGKNREIRRAMAAIGLTVNRLIRISYGPFRLNELQPGEVEEVRPKVLRDQLGLSGGEADVPAGRPAPRGAKPAPRGASAGADHPGKPAPRPAPRPAGNRAEGVPPKAAAKTDRGGPRGGDASRAGAGKPVPQAPRDGAGGRPARPGGRSFQAVTHGDDAPRPVRGGKPAARGHAASLAKGPRAAEDARPPRPVGKAPAPRPAPAGGKPPRGPAPTRPAGGKPAPRRPGGKG